MRELLPWHATGESSASPSGIRLAEAPASDVSPVAERARGTEANADASEVTPTTSEPLSFQVYSLAELDARRPDADPAWRMSRVMFELAPKPRNPWSVVGERGRELAAEGLAWALAYARTKQRPDLAPLRTRGLILRGALEGALRVVDWKRVYVYAGASLATVVTMLAIVLTVADLTDDLAPARATREPKADVTKAALASAVSTAARAEVAGTGALAAPAPAPVAAAPAPSPSPEAAPIELDESSTAPAKVMRVAPARPRAPAKQPAPARAALALSGSPLPGGPLARTAPAPAKGGAKTKLSFRDADEVFRP